VCFILEAVGLFVIPHDVAPRELLSEAFNSTAANHNQTLYGLIIIIGGLVGAAVGIAWGSSEKAES
jgi:uncharacterized membrane protein